MKKVILSVAFVTVIGRVSCKNDVKQDQEKETTEVVETTDTSQDMTMTAMSFGVRGNCSMCKETIEKAANGVKGVAMANWDKDMKKIDVKFDDSKTDAMAIHEAIAASGYDTENLDADDEAYNKLPQCCQYDHGMTMNRAAQMPND